jgi:DNA-binding beta-propeller fold protein YncE
MLKRPGSQSRNRSSIWTVLFFVVGCGSSGATGGIAGPSGCAGGGLNENQKGVGDQAGGVQLAIGDIAVAPSGSFVVFKMDGDLAVGFPETGAVQKLPVVSPTKLVFSKARDVIYVGSQLDSKLHAIDVRKGEELWAAPGVVDDSVKLAASKDDRRVLAAKSDGAVALLDAATGEVLATHTVSGGFLEDMEILPDDKRALIVPVHTWSADQTEPLTVVTVLELEAGATRTFDVPNCSDNIVVTPAGDRAFLAPTTCNKDPISYIDLAPGAEAYVKNLPGFGPVAMAPDGVTAVGFLDVGAADDSLFEDPSQKPDPTGPRYHLMVIDTQSLAYKFFASGEELPRYAITPDGNVLLVDSAASSPARIFDTKTGIFHAVEGPPVNLDNFVISSDSAHAYVLQTTVTQADPTVPPTEEEMLHELFDLDVIQLKSAKIPVGFEPMNINISPDDATLFLREDSANICVFSIADQACRSRISGVEVALPSGE